MRKCAIKLIRFQNYTCTNTGNILVSLQNALEIAALWVFICRINLQQFRKFQRIKLPLLYL